MTLGKRKGVAVLVFLSGSPRKKGRVRASTLHLLHHRLLRPPKKKEIRSRAQQEQAARTRSTADMEDAVVSKGWIRMRHAGVTSKKKGKENVKR